MLLSHKTPFYFVQTYLLPLMSVASEQLCPRDSRFATEISGRYKNITKFEFSKEKEVGQREVASTIVTD